jgi:hypothetical protein
MPKDAVMLYAYLDESGIHGNAEACIVAGYFGKKGPWRRFEAQWESILGNRDFRVPLDKFHASKLIKRKGFFADWSLDRRDDFLNSLGNAVAACKVHPVCYGLFMADFYGFSLEERRFLTGATWDANQRRFRSTGCPSRPYFVAFNECLKVVTSYTPATERANFFFGVDRPAGDYATVLFRYLKTRSRIISTDKFGNIGFPLASVTPRLQLADLFSYLSYRHMLERRASGDWTSNPSALLLPLLRNRRSPEDTSFRTAALLRDMISVVPHLPRSSPTTPRNGVAAQAASE